LSPLIDLAADGEVPRGTSPSAAAKYFSAKFILGAEEVDMQYSDMFKDAMIQKLTGPDAISASALSKQVDVPQSTLSKWLRMAGVGPSYFFPNNAHEYTKMAKINNSKRPDDWSAEDKLKVVMEASLLDDEQLGAFLRSKGLHKTHLDQWRLQMLDGLQNGSSKKKSRRKNVDAKRIRTLEKELNRKDKALAETAALLVLKKKVQEIWGDEDSPTDGSNGK
jgi:transposase-like protein